MALITGGGTGLGADFTRRFVAEGAKVVITGRRKELLEKVASELPAGAVLVFQETFRTSRRLRRWSARLSNSAASSMSW